MATPAPAPRTPTVWLSRKAAAKYLGIEPQTLAQWASSGRYALRYFKVGSKAVRYRQRDLDAFIESRAFEPTPAGR